MKPRPGGSCEWQCSNEGPGSSATKSISTLETGHVDRILSSRRQWPCRPPWLPRSVAVQVDRMVVAALVGHREAIAAFPAPPRQLRVLGQDWPFSSSGYIRRRPPGTFSKRSSTRSSGAGTASGRRRSYSPTPIAGLPIFSAHRGVGVLDDGTQADPASRPGSRQIQTPGRLSPRPRRHVPRRRGTPPRRFAGTAPDCHRAPRRSCVCPASASVMFLSRARVEQAEQNALPFSHADRSPCPSIRSLKDADA